MNTQAHKEDLTRETVHDWLMSYSQGGENDYILACIISSWLTGEGVLSDWLGLGQENFIALLGFHFPGIDFYSMVNPGRDLDKSRLDEREELLQLLSSHYAGKFIAEQWIAEIVVDACQGQNHLWQDLGLWSRKDLTQLMAQNFPTLAARNDKDMKWKKFLYKQLCIAEGIYTCRAPSCQVCVDYAQCFGPEE